MDVNMLFIKKN